MTSSILAVGSGILLSALVLASGCAMNTEVEEENVASQSAALTTDFFDGSGLVHIQVNTCNWSASDPHPIASCGVNPGFVLVGGGAEVQGQAGGGGLLTHSFPQLNKLLWTVASKDHVVPFPHSIRAYSVGMQLQGMDVATLRSLVKITTATSAASHAPSATVTIPPAHVMLSGGAFSNYQGQGQLLTESYPSSDTTWTASAKDHQASDIASVTAYVISVPICLNNQWVEQRCLNTFTAGNDANFVPTNYSVVDADTPMGFAPVGVGGRAEFTGAGRLLTDLFPVVGVNGAGATAVSKDHNIVSGGTTRVWARSITVF